jgi:uncharacterized protein (DUF736 family)
MDYKKPYEEKPNTGSFFANKTKTNPKAPDYRGKIVLDLSTYDVVNGNIVVELAGWKQTAKSGLSYLQLKAQKPREDQSSKPVREEIQDDNIEF